VEGDRAARAALALGTWVLVAGFASGFPRSALGGFVARDMSAVLVVGCLAMWAVARRLSERGRYALVPVLLSGLGVSLAVGVLQLVFDVRTGTFAMNGGRPSGLTTNPVYFGGLMTAASTLCAATVSSQGSEASPAGSRRSRVAWLVCAGLFAVGASISGSRIAILAMICLAAVLLIWRRVHALAAVGAMGVGVVLGALFQQAVGTSSDALSRAGDGGGGLDGRMQIWRYALSAIGEKPIFGWGFGRFQASVQGRYSAEFVTSYASQDLGVAWFDAHNLLIGIVNAIGVIGLVLAAVWIATTVRGVDRTLVIFPVALLATWMLQPPALATLPLAALVLGAASRPPAHHPIGDSEALLRRRWIHRSAVAAGLAACCYLVVVDVAFYAVTDQLDGSASESVAAFYPGDPVAAGLVAQVWAYDTLDNASPQAIEWQERAVDRDPERPYWRVRLAERYLMAGRYDDAWTQLDRSLDLQPFHPESVRLRVAVAARMQDEARLGQAIAAACEIDPAACELDMGKLLELAAAAE
jgi:O-antigen ligase